MPKIMYDGIEFDSEEERLFFLYVKELKQEGFVKEFSFHNKEFVLSEVVKFSWKKFLKTKEKDVETTLLHPHVYTPDFHIKWNPKAYGIFYCYIDDEHKFGKIPFINNIDNNGDDIGSYVEVKPAFDFKNMTRLSVINIKWVYSEYKIFVQTITPISKGKCLFNDTFVPKEALFTKTGKNKKYNFKLKYLEDFINTDRIEKDRG